MIGQQVRKANFKFESPENSFAFSNSNKRERRINLTIRFQSNQIVLIIFSVSAHWIIPDCVSVIGYRDFASELPPSWDDWIFKENERKKKRFYFCISLAISRPWRSFCKWQNDNDNDANDNDGRWVGRSFSLSFLFPAFASALFPGRFLLSSSHVSRRHLSRQNAQPWRRHDEASPGNV